MLAGWVSAPGPPTRAHPCLVGAVRAARSSVALSMLCHLPFEMSADLGRGEAFPRQNSSDFWDDLLPELSGAGHLQDSQGPRLLAYDAKLQNNFNIP